MEATKSLCYYFYSNFTKKILECSFPLRQEFNLNQAGHFEDSFFWNRGSF